MKATLKRATVYLDASLDKVLREKAAETDQSVSDLVNDAVRLALEEEKEDLTSFEQRAHEPDLPFEAVVKDLKARGKL